MSWVRFNETMRGKLVFGLTDPTADPPADAWMFGVVLRLRVEGEAERFLADPSHEAQVTGYVESGRLGGERPILRGTFNLFTYGDDFYQRRMLYRIHFRDGTGRPLLLVGEKLVPRLPAVSPWRDTTTLFTHLSRYTDDGRVIAAAGVLRVSLLNVLGQLVTMRASRPSIVVRLLAYFLGTLARVYLRR
jgi:cholesterol oxidase